MLGTSDADRIVFEVARWDSILPVNMAGMSVLDVGCHNGGFCVESANRGASSVHGVDYDEEALDVLRYMADRWELPISTQRCDLRQELPAASNAGRYDLGLLLNVIQHLDRPECLLRAMMDLCSHVVLETPCRMVAWNGSGFDDGGPVAVPWSRYEGQRHVAPAWVARIAEGGGFRLDSMTLGPYLPEQRLIFHLQRH
jgi:SAM-dependent methyltransferase